MYTLLQALSMQSVGNLSQKLAYLLNLINLSFSGNVCWLHFCSFLRRLCFVDILVPVWFRLGIQLGLVVYRKQELTQRLENINMLL